MAFFFSTAASSRASKPSTRKPKAKAPGDGSSGKEPLRVALVGSPNSGKTTLFNGLTGLSRRVANYPGVTVEHIEGTCRLENGDRVTMIDLPGTYTLEPLSRDEAVTASVLEGSLEGAEQPDALMVVADATTLRRSLALVVETLAVGLPTIVVLTMIDELKAQKGSVDVGLLQQILGVPVIGVVGNRGLGIDDLRAVLEDPEPWFHAPNPVILHESDEADSDRIIALDGAEASLSTEEADAHEGAGNGKTGGAPVQIDIQGRLAVLSPDQVDDVTRRLVWADAVYDAVVTPPEEATTPTDKVDRVLLHPVWGLGIFVLTMFIFFQVIFVVAAPLQGGLEGLVLSGGESLRSLIPDGLAQSLVVDGIIGGVGSVVVFLPQIALLLLMVRFLESVGYMARAAFLVDRVMGWAGLEGRAFVALLSSYACAVPGIMATRSVPDPRSRLATILVAPFMTCSARLPVYALLIGAFIPATTVGGIFDVQGLTLFGLYLLGSLSALLVAGILKRGILRGATYPFYMELPPYRVPTANVVIKQVWGGVKAFLKKAGTIILAASVVLWFLLTFPRVDVPDSVASDEAAAAAYQLEQSYAADVGKAIEPAIEPLGFDWKIGVGLVASLAAREVIVATMGQIYAYGGDEEDVQGLGERMRTEVDPDTGEPLYGLPMALALLVFFVYALQCVSTLAIMRRETNSYRWPAFAFTYMLAIAWVGAFATYHLSSWLLA